MKLPALLKENCLNQLDQSLVNIKATERLALSLGNKISDGHIATALVTKALSECSGIEFSMVALEAKALARLPAQVSVMVLSKNGDSFLLQRVEGIDQYSLSSYFNVDEVIFCHEGNLSDLAKEFDLVEQVFLFQPAIQSKKSDSKGAESYTYRHFFVHKSTIWSILGAAVFMALLGVATPLGFQTFTDKILPYSATGSLYVIAVFLLLSAVASSVFQCYHDFQENVLFAKYQNGLGKEVFRRLLDMDIPYFDKNKVGDLTKLVDQVEEASNFLVRQALSSVVSLISLIVVLPILFVYSIKLTAIVLGIGVFMAVTIGLALKPIRHRVMQAYTYDAGFQSTLIETLKGIKTIKSLANEAHFRNRANIALETNLYGGFNVARLSNVIRALVGFQSQLITIAVIFFGAQAVFANELSIGQLIAFNMLANNVVNPLVSLVMTASGWENFKLANRKLNELKPPSSPIMMLGHEEVDLNGDIVFDNVWFRYPEAEGDSYPAHFQGEDKWVLKGVSFTIKRGEIVGIVGSSGSGKSTIAALLMGFYLPNKGKIKVNGFDISFISPKLLRSRISSVQQTSFLFNTSVMENIHLGRLSSSIEDIYHSLQGAGAEEFVDEMPHKMFTPLAEDGGNLSGGQRQRLAIARALVRQSDILLFDEATSALDNQTEDKIKETIYQACQDKTGLIIAHRLNTLSYCHHLIVMSHGEVEVMGSHDELILLDNSYQKMWASLSRKGQPVLGLREGNMSKDEDLKDAVQF